MAVVADRVVVDLEVRRAKADADLRGYRQNFEQTFKSTANSAKEAERQIASSSDGIKRALLASAASIAAAFSIGAITQLADAYTRFTNQLKVAGLEGDNLAGIQGSLFDIAQKYGTELESLGTLYGRLSASGKDLGASQADLLKFTEGVSAALKVQGGDAASASGALLQLSQALGGGVVRAEEFNSVMEGARPIAQAVADNIDRFGGSVSKLRTEIADGKVTSEEFFRAFLKGSADLEAKAANASLTVAASYTVLRNSLTKYIGEADASLGVTEKISAALALLAENLDVIIPAIAILATGLGVSFVASATAAAIASGTLGTTMLAAFGGPVGIAITALIVGIAGVAVEMNEASKASDVLTKTIRETESEVEKITGRAKEAGGSIRQLSSEVRDATTDLGPYQDQVIAAANELYGLRDAARAAAIAQLQQRRVQLSTQYAAAEQRSPSGLRRDLNNPVASVKDFFDRTKRIVGGAASYVYTAGESDRENARNMADAAEAMRSLDREIQALFNGAPINPADPDGGGAPKGDKAGKKSRGARGAARYTGPLPANVKRAIAEGRMTEETARTNWPDGDFPLDGSVVAEMVEVNPDTVVDFGKLGAFAKTIESNPDGFKAAGESLADAIGPSTEAYNAIRDNFADSFADGVMEALQSGDVGEVARQAFLEWGTAGLKDVLTQIGGALFSAISPNSGGTFGGGGGFLNGLVRAVIPGFASGTRNAPGGLAVVGERGREIVNLPRGSSVLPNGQTEAILGGRSSVYQAFHLHAEGAVMTDQLIAGLSADASRKAAAAYRGSVNASRRGLPTAQLSQNLLGTT